MRRGQLTIQGIMFVFLGLLFLALLSPLFYDLISMVNGNATASGDAKTPVITSLLVPFLFIGLLVGIVVYVTGGWGRNREEG